MKHFFRKVAAAVFAVAALFAPVHSAAAWNEVCMHLPLWDAGFAAHFHVVHGFDGDVPGLPYAVWADEEVEENFWEGGNVISPLRDELINRRDLLNYQKTASNQVQSGSIRANQTRCVNISGMYDGEPFFVLANVHGKAGRNYVYCEIHPSAAAVNPWYNQTDRPYRRINFKAWGSVFNPQCEFTRESN